MVPTVQEHSRMTGEFIVDTDACDTKFGCVLLQEQPNKNKGPIGYWSKTLHQEYSDYVNTHREGLFVVWTFI